VPMTVRPFTSPSPKPWQPDVTSRTEYRADIEDYMRDVKAQAIAAGMREEPRPLRQREPKHYEWLVRYQVKGDDLPLIARTSRETQDRVWKGIKDLARNIGLKPRK
jgi:hypothetical protein